jgi:Zn-dependent membrane protease YugP
VVEVDASRRALRDLRALAPAGLDERGVRRILVAAGATYVVDTLLDVGYIVRRLHREDANDGSGEDRSADGGGDDDSGFFRRIFD